MAEVLGLSARQVRRFVQDGFLSPRRGPRGALEFDFQDLVVLRTAKGLVDAQVAPRRVRRALSALSSRLPAGASLSGVQISLEGEDLVVRDGAGRFEPVSGQAVFDFAVDDLRAQIAPFEARAYPMEQPEFLSDDAWPECTVIALDGLPGEEPPLEADEDPGAAGWAAIAEALEGDRRPAQARDAWRRALELAPFDVGARQRLARLLAQEGRYEAAEAQARLNRRLSPEDPDLALDHARMLAALGEHGAALDAFEFARQAAPDLVEAYRGAAEMHERLGDSSAAVRVLGELRRLRRDPPDR